MTLTPAYGRDYTSAKAAIEDFKAGKDFVLNDWRGSTYCNLASFADKPDSTWVQLRYKRNTMVTAIKLGDVR